MKKLVWASVVALGIVVAGFLFVSNQSVSDVSQPVISNTNRGEPLAEVTPVPVFGVNQAKVNTPNPLKFTYDLLLDDYGFAMFRLSKLSLYDDKVEIEDMRDLYLVSYSSAKKVLESVGNTLPTEDQFGDLLDEAFAKAKKEFKEHPEQFSNDETLAYMQHMGLVFATVISGSVHVYVGERGDGSIEHALSEAFDAVAEKIDDKYAAFMPPEEAQSLEDSLNETLHFSGIGARLMVTEDGKGVEIGYTYTGSPAHMAGLLPGDIIVKVNGEPVEAQSLEKVGDITDKIKGDAGTIVVLGVKRGTEELEFKIERAPIQGSTAIGYRHGDYAHIILSSFGKQSDRDIQRALDMLAIPGKPLKGIILDLRENGGGVLGGAIRIYDMFEKAGVKVVTTTSRHVQKGREVSDTSNNTDTVLKTEDNSGMLNVPLVLLTNGNSASASEILSGSMQDNERAFIIGTKTYGKGIAQGVMPLYGDPQTHATVKFTTEEFFVGKDKVRIHHIGVEPNTVVEQGLPENLVDPQTFEQRMAREDAMTRIMHRSDPAKDPVLKAGLEYLDLYNQGQ